MGHCLSNLETALQPPHNRMGLSDALLVATICWPVSPPEDNTIETYSLGKPWPMTAAITLVGQVFFVARACATTMHGPETSYVHPVQVESPSMMAY